LPRGSHFTVFLVAALAGCGGSGTFPGGSVVNSPGGGGGQPTQLVDVKVTVTIPARSKQHGMRPDYISANTQSLVIGLTSVDGKSVTGVNPTTIDTLPKSRGCKAQGNETVCTGTAKGSPGEDVFAVTTYGGTNGTGSVLSVGNVQQKIASSGSGVQIDQLTLSLDGIIASLGLSLSPNIGKRGTPVKANVSLTAYDATGAQIVGGSDYAAPILLSIQGDSNSAFTLHAGGSSGTELTVRKPASNLSLTYNGNKQASTVTIEATVNGAKNISAATAFKLKGKQPPPPVGTIYALNLGTNEGQGATITEYDGSANGDAAPQRTLQLSSKLYARSIAVDANNNLYVGYLDSATGFSISQGTPDKGNEIAVYAPNASGNDQPTGFITADSSTKTLIFPLYMALDPSGNLVTYGATSVDGNDGNDSVLIYSAGSSGAVAPANAWAFLTPQIRYAGPTGLALDSAGNFYVNGALHAPSGAAYGTYAAPAADDGNPSVNPSRTIPWNATSELTPPYVTNDSVSDNGEIYIGNTQLSGSGYPPCQARVNVYGAGASGGSSAPLRVLTLDTVVTTNSGCISPFNALTPFFPSISLFGSTLFATDDFNNAVLAFPANGNNTVKPTARIVGSATGLNAPIAVAVTSNSGQATARPVHPR